MKHAFHHIVFWLIAPCALLHAAQPSIVLIMADDLGYGTLSCYGNKEVKTPHIDALAASGMRFTDYHSNGPLCSPTRAALMTGRYQQRCIHVPDEELSPVFREQRKENPAQRWAWGISSAELTLPTVLRQVGYRTALIGKWHLGYDTKFHPMNHGFDEFRGWLGGAVDNHTHIATHGTQERDWWNGRKIENEEGYSTDLLTKHAIDFITRHKDAPFFLYLAHGAVHTPLQSRDPGKKASPVSLYKEVIGHLDESVGTVMTHLRELQLEASTLVLFCSDNGPAAPGGFSAASGLRGKKGTLHEGGHRVPFIASWPGIIPAGTISDEAVMTMDLLPTFASLASAPLPTKPQMDGQDITPILKGSASKSQRDLHWQSGHDWAVRSGTWKLIGQKNKPTFLVNLTNDIGESVNLLQSEPARADELMKAHRLWLKSLEN